jgi:hypothetical protein
MGQTIQGLPGEGNLQESRCAELCATTRGFTEGQFGHRARVAFIRIW